jgi:hypothetical protein
MYKIGHLWINLDQITWAIDDPSIDPDGDVAETLTLVFRGPENTVKLRGKNRKRMLQALEHVTTEIV